MSSKSSSAQRSSNADNRVAGDNGAIAVGSGAVVSFDNSTNFDSNVLDAFGQLVDIAKTSLSTVKDTVAGAGNVIKQSTQALADTKQLINSGTTANNSNPLPLVVAGVAGVLVLIYIIKMKG